MVFQSKQSDSRYSLRCADKVCVLYSVYAFTKPATTHRAVVTHMVATIVTPNKFLQEWSQLHTMGKFCHCRAVGRSYNILFPFRRKKYSWWMEREMKYKLSETKHKL